MNTENLSTLKIHKLTQEQYDRELAAGRIDENALYLTPDEEKDLSLYATTEYVDTLTENLQTQLNATKAVYTSLSEIGLDDNNFDGKDFNTILHEIYKAFVGMNAGTANTLKIYVSGSINKKMHKAINDKLNADFESTSYTLNRAVTIDRNNNNLIVVMDTSATTDISRQFTCKAYANNSDIYVTKFINSFEADGFFSKRNPVNLEDSKYTIGTLPVTKGGTGATTAEGALKNLGLESILTDVSNKANQTDLNTHTDNTNIHVTAAEKEAWNAVKEDVDVFFKDASFSESAKDTLKEIQSYIDSDASAAAEMLESISNKADAANHKIITYNSLADINLADTDFVDDSGNLLSYIECFQKFYSTKAMSAGQELHLTPISSNTTSCPNLYALITKKLQEDVGITTIYSINVKILRLSHILKIIVNLTSGTLYGHEYSCVYRGADATNKYLSLFTATMRPEGFVSINGSTPMTGDLTIGKNAANARFIASSKKTEEVEGTVVTTVDNETRLSNLYSSNVGVVHVKNNLDTTGAYRQLRVYNSTGNSNISNALALYDNDGSSGTTYKIYHQGNKPTAADVGAVNPNLLRNWYFVNPVNSRGYTSYNLNSTDKIIDSCYTIDGWYARESSGSLVLEEDGLKITNTGSVSMYVEQFINPTPTDQITTLSALFSEVSGTAWIQVIFAGHENWGAVNGKIQDGLKNITNNRPEDIGDSVVKVLIQLEAGASLKIKAVKLEYGTSQTLTHQDASGNWVLNEVPDYNEELLKCIQSTIDPSDEYANKIIYHTGNKPTAADLELAKVATSGNYSDLTDTPDIPTAASVTPKAAGTAAVGISDKYSREDHVHPAQTDITGNAGSATRVSISAGTADKERGIVVFNENESGSNLSYASGVTINYKNNTITAPGGFIGNASNVTGVVAIENGGTGATTVAAALTALGAAPSGFGLGTTAKGISNTDLLDTLKLGKSGWYRGNNVTNAPSTSWYYFQVIADSFNFAYVLAYKYDGRIYRAFWDSGKFYGWTKLYDEINKPTAADIGAAVNPNILRNWYFASPINSRGQTEYTGPVYTIDGWKARRANSSTTPTTTISAENASVKISADGGTCYFTQYLANIPNGTYTGSILVKSVSGTPNSSGNYGSLYSSDGSTTIKSSYIKSADLYTITFTHNGESPVKTFQLSIVNGCTIEIVAAKFERGSIQTLARQDESGNWVLNETPDYTEELLKCYMSTADSEDAYSGNKKIDELFNVQKIYNSLDDIGMTDAELADASGNLVDIMELYNSLYSKLSAGTELNLMTIDYATNLAKLIKAKLSNDLGVTTTSYYNIRFQRFGYIIKTIINPCTNTSNQCYYEYSCVYRGYGDNKLLSTFTETMNPNGFAPATHTHSASDITSGTLPITNGGTGATTAADALTNLGITYGTADKTAGSSSLTTGSFYFVYS